MTRTGHLCSERQQREVELDSVAVAQSVQLPSTCEALEWMLSNIATAHGGGGL